jgi:hypothetical protein
VDLPVVDLASPAAARQRHSDLLRACDGLLLYRQAAPPEWLLHHLPDLMFAESILKRGPIRSKAVLVDDPAQLAGQPPAIRVIPRTKDFSVRDLEPFLAPLRPAGGPRAGA